MRGSSSSQTTKAPNAQSTRRATGSTPSPEQTPAATAVLINREALGDWYLYSIVSDGRRYAASSMVQEGRVKPLKLTIHPGMVSLTDEASGDVAFGSYDERAHRMTFGNNVYDTVLTDALLTLTSDGKTMEYRRERHDSLSDPETDSEADYRSYLGTWMVTGIRVNDKLEIISAEGFDATQAAETQFISIRPQIIAMGTYSGSIDDNPKLAAAYVDLPTAVTNGRFDAYLGNVDSAYAFAMGVDGCLYVTLNVAQTDVTMSMRCERASETVERFVSEQLAHYSYRPMQVRTTELISVHIGENANNTSSSRDEIGILPIEVYALLRMYYDYWYHVVLLMDEGPALDMSAILLLTTPEGRTYGEQYSCTYDGEAENPELSCTLPLYSLLDSCEADGALVRGDYLVELYFDGAFVSSATLQVK